MEVTTVNRGVALLNLQRIDEAKALLEKAVKNNPEDATPGITSASITRTRPIAAAAV